MGIEIVDKDTLGTVDKESLGSCELRFEYEGKSHVAEGHYHKCPETGEVQMALDDHDDWPTDHPVMIILHDHDGKDSEYHGKFNEDGHLR